MNRIKNIGIAGGGTMGASMAYIFASYDFKVIVYDAFQSGIDRAKNIIDLSLDSLIKSNDITMQKVSEIKKNINFTLNINDFQNCDIVIESIPEELKLKQDFWQKTTKIVKNECICASNTSGLSINAVFKNAADKSRCCGMHWFNPPHLIPLIEVINSDDTKQEIANKVYDLALKIGKKPIYVKKDSLGFIGNRLQAAILREALHIVEQGIGDYKDVDGAMKYGLGFRYACLGPCEVVDHGGIDIHYNIASYLWKDLSDAKIPYGKFSAIYKAGNYGVKTGQGFYDYDGDKAKKAINARDNMYQAIAKCKLAEISKKHGYEN